MNDAPPRKDRWINGNEEDGVNLWSLGLWTPGFLFDFVRISKVGPWYHIFEFDRGHMKWLVLERYSLKVANQLLRKLLKQSTYFSWTRRHVVRTSDTLYRFGKKVQKTQMRLLSDSALLKIFSRHKKLVLETIGYGMISTLTEVPHGQFVEYLGGLLQKKVEAPKLKRSAAEYLSILSAVPEESMARLELRGLLKLLQLKKKLKTHKAAFEKKVAEHVRKFCWAYYGYEGPAFGTKRVLSELKKMEKEGTDPSAEMRKMDKERAQILPNIRRAEKELGLNRYERQLFQALRDTVFTKLYRKDAISFSFFAMEGAIKEIARRAGISFIEAKYIAPGEHAKVLNGDQALKRELKQRSIYCVYSGATLKPFILVGDKAHQYINKMYKEKKIGNLKELKGQPACLGQAKGIVKIVNVIADMKKMKLGDILVSVATIPDIVPAMKKAAAIVTEQGGITCHAAIVSRELGIPCVIGTKIATKVFKDGDRVEVDAVNGIIRKTN